MREQDKTKDEDLSAEIVAHVERRPGDQVKCSRVFGRRYRCNWWCAARSDEYDNPAMRGGQIGTAHTIRKSQFLEVTREGTGLRINVISTSEDEAGGDDQSAGSRRAPG